MTADDARHWDERHAQRPPASPAPPDALAEAGLVERVPTRGRALDIACGAGAQTLWLAQRGLDVTALDVSRVAIDRLRSAADAAGVAERVTALVTDLDGGLDGDLGVFDVIVCQRFRDPDLYDAIRTRLRVDGLAVVTVLSQIGDESSGSFRAPAGELLRAFTCDGFEVVHHLEGRGVASIVVERIEPVDGSGAVDEARYGEQGG